MEVFEAASAASSSTWRGIMDSCAKIWHDLEGLVDCCSDSLLILHRSKWQCLARTYSTVIDSLTKQTEKAFSNLNQEITLCQKLLVSLDVLHHAMQEGERCFKDCICKSSEINHSWLVEKALKFSILSTDIIDIHLHDFIWAYAAVKEQALWLGIHLDGMELLDLEEETSILCTIWAAEDTKSDLCTVQEQLLTNFMEEESLNLAKFILNKITHVIADIKVEVEAHPVLPDFLWVDPTSLKRNHDYIIANGSYGVVYEATWLGGRFAVKEILHAAEDAHSGREQAIQARLCHSNVINFVCCTKNPSSKRLCLVMELMQQDLQFLMKRRKQDGMDPPFTPLEAIDLMLQIAKGMEYLHSLNIMHRDLKSSNILVSFPPISNYQQIRYHTAVHLKIADFGTAKAKQMSASFTTKPIGTRAWRAPEVGSSDAHAKYHKSADVYSFGMVCYEILTGELPFKETQHLEMRVMRGERPDLPNYCARALASYIERCWDGNPAARPSFTCICRMLRYLKACILLQNSHESPSYNIIAPYNCLAHSVPSRACARITGMLDSSMSALPPPLRILLEMYWCRIVLKGSHEDPESSIVLQEIHEDPESSGRLEGISDYTTTPSSSLEHYVEQANDFSLESSTQEDENLNLQPKVEKMTLKELQVATNNFNVMNMLDDNGYERVYKGTLSSGSVVAIKKLAEIWFDQFQNELNLLNALRHRNLIQLLGYCVEDCELLLVYKYEFLCFGRLDNLLFDNLLFGRRCEALDWAARVNIIKGVAKGLCYLHDDAPFKVVHRDIKPRNIYLDETMNPKISDFGLAIRQFNDAANVSCAIATGDHIAPESMTEEFTEKIDVYSFGILILETVSGQRRTSDSGLDALIRAWSLFENEEEMRLLDPRITNWTEVRVDEVKRVVRVALLCTQTEADERPSMSQMYTMLSNEDEYVPLPSKPLSSAFSDEDSY